jgi:hypothetical protein
MDGKPRLKIREFFSPSNDMYGETYVGIDTFENIKERLNEYKSYSLVLVGIDNKYYPGKHLYLRNNSFDICEDDRYSKPSIRSYILLGEALKRKGFIFNKKKGELVYVGIENKKETIF